MYRNAKCESSVKYGLADYRKMSNLTQEDIASKLGMSRMTYYRKETGLTNFKKNEMVRIYDIIYPILKPVLPNLKLADLFF